MEASSGGHGDNGHGHRGFEHHQSHGHAGAPGHTAGADHGRRDEGALDGFPRASPGGLLAVFRAALPIGEASGAGAHTHAGMDGSLVSGDRGIWALKWSFVGLGLTALVQAAVAAISGSAGLLADTIHNFADATTSLPLWLAFVLERRAASRRFTYGMHRAEDLAGLAIVVVIFSSALLAGYTSIQRLIAQEMPAHVPLAMGAALAGFIGNEVVAQLRIRVGREIGSAALVADGLHARTDGLTSLAALAGLAGALAGYPIFDGVAGLLITAMILAILARDAGPAIFARLLDAIEPQTVDRLHQAAASVDGVQEVNWVRARWSGHAVDAEVNVRVDPALTLADVHAISHRVEHEMSHALEHPGSVLVVASTHRERLGGRHAHAPPAPAP